MLFDQSKHIHRESMEVKKIGKGHNDTFTIVVMPDTQEYYNFSVNEDDCFASQVHWILNAEHEYSIKFVTHLGDIVKKDKHKYWKRARDLLLPIAEKYPFGLCVGNRDLKYKIGPDTKFCKYFSSKVFEDKSWYGGSFRNNRSSFQLIEVNSRPYMFIHLEINADDLSIEWANEVINAHPQHEVIIITHMFLGKLHRPIDQLDKALGPVGVMTWKKCYQNIGNTPVQLWEKCFKKHGNIKMILCGDQSFLQSLHMQLVGDQGNLVQVMMSDYGDGSFRLLNIDQKNNLLRVTTLSADGKKNINKTNLLRGQQDHQFTLRWPTSNK